MKLRVAVPAYDGKVNVGTARALLNEQLAAHLAGIEMTVAFVPGCSLISQARNQIAADFMASKNDRLVMLDSDIEFEPGALLRIATHPVDFCGGTYRFKRPVEGYPIGWLDKPELWADPATGLLEVASLPGGFMSVSRAVFERLKEAHPTRAYSFDGHDFHAYFHCPPGGGEDGAFCTDWRAIGGQVWLDPELTLTHTGGNPSYTGNVGSWLKGR